MSVATRNPFALLDAEDNSADAPPAKSAPEAPLPATRDAPKKTGPATRGGGYYRRGGGSKPANALSRDAPAEDAPADGGQKKFDGEGRGRGRGRGGRGGDRGDRSDRSGRGGNRGGHRQFDRHSMTGKTDSDKKMHQSWGGDDGNTELKTEVAATNDAAAEANWGGAVDSADAWATPAGATNDEPWGGPTGDAAPAEGADKPTSERRPRDREVEEEDNTLTLEQYLANKKDSEVIPKLEGTRKANEGADASIWKDVVPLKKADEDEDAYFVGKGKAAPKARTEKKEKVFLEIEARFDRPQRGGGRGRGDRGGDRGGDRARAPARGRGGPGPRYNQGAPVNVDDEKAFPSLS